MKSHTWITIGILAGLVAGTVVGQMLFDPDFDPAVDPDSAHKHATALFYFVFGGKTLFMGLLKMLIVPLIISSVIVGVTSLGDVRKLGGVGIATVVYYFSTMLIAVTVGLCLVSFLRPGDGFDLEPVQQAADVAFEARQERIEQGPGGIGPALLRIVASMIPSNPFAAFADPGIAALPTITFSLFFGVVLTTIGERSKPVIELFRAVFEVMMKMVHIVIMLAPLGVFCLLAWTVSRIGVGVFLGAMAKYMSTVLLGLGVHGLIVLPLILWLFTRVNPLKFASKMREALLTAFGTDSSSATLPVTIECATEQAGCSKKASGFVLPLGATINMDGTALYEAVAVVFLAQVFGLELGLEQAIIVALTATLAAVGAAGIPEAGLVTMVIVIAAVNQNVLEGDPTTATIPIAAVGLIIGVDRILDMCRTTVNVWGDAVGARIITRIAPDSPESSDAPPQDATA